MPDRERDPRLTFVMVALIVILIAAVLAWIGGRSGNDDEPANTNPAPASKLLDREEDP